MLQFLAVTQVLIVVGLIALILMHSGRDAGMGGLGFTPASQGGTHIVEKNLTRITVVFAVLFFVNSIALFKYLERGATAAGFAAGATLPPLSRWWRNW